MGNLATGRRTKPLLTSARLAEQNLFHNAHTCMLWVYPEFN